MLQTTLNQNPQTVNPETIHVVNSANEVPLGSLIRFAGDTEYGVYRIMGGYAGKRRLHFVFNDIPQQHPADLWPIDEAFEAEMNMLAYEALDIPELPFVQADYIS